MDPKTDTTTNTGLPAGEIFGIGNKMSDGTGVPNDEAKKVEKHYSSAVELSPLEVEKKKWYESEIRENNARVWFWKVMTTGIPLVLAIATLAFTFYTAQFTYYLQGVSEPMGAIKEDLKNKEKDIDRLEQELRELRNADRAKASE